MPVATIDDQLNAYLADAHAIEVQALAQLRPAKAIARPPAIHDAFGKHIPETKGHERRMRERLRARGIEPSRPKDMVARAGGWGMVAFALAQPDTPGKLAAHAYSYEALEEAAYALLGIVAERAGDEQTKEAAAAIRDEEKQMAERLAHGLDEAAGSSLAALGPHSLGKQLTKYLTDAHAIEMQAIGLLEHAPKLSGGDSQLTSLYEEHLAETREHERLIGDRLRSRGAQPSRIKDGALRMGAINIGGFFGLQPDTPLKLAGFAYAFEHLEIAGYEQLRRVARKVGDDHTVEAVDRILTDERRAAAKIAGMFPHAVTVTMERRGLV